MKIIIKGFKIFVYAIAAVFFIILAIVSIVAWALGHFILLIAYTVANILVYFSDKYYDLECKYNANKQN